MCLGQAVIEDIDRPLQQILRLPLDRCDLAHDARSWFVHAPRTGRSSVPGFCGFPVRSVRSDFMLRDTKVRVLEITPPWVRTELMNSLEAGQAMPVNQFIAEAIKTLGTDTNEIIVGAAKRMRD